MLDVSIASHVRAAAKRFAGANQGNIAVIFAIALVPILTFMGAAIDYSRANSARSSMQSALDSTALMLSKDLADGRITTADIDAKAKTYFAALYTNKDSTVATPDIHGTYTAKDPTTGLSNIVVTGSGYVDADFMRVAGFPKLGFNTGSTSTWGNTKMRVALALDNTGSMASAGKITALRTAVAGAGGLIDQLSKLAATPGDVYISVIPFAKVVNVGASNYSQTWIDWTDWQNPPTQQPNNGSYQAALPNSKFTLAQWANVGPGSSCPFTSTNGFANFKCTTSPVNASSSASTIPKTGSYTGYICPGLDSASHTFYNGCWDSVQTSSTATICTGSTCSCPTSGSNIPNNTCTCSGSGSSLTCKVKTFTHTWHANATSTWTGCVTDRTQNNDATGVLPVTSDVTTQFPANQYGEGSPSYCSSSSSTPLEPIIPLSYNWTTLKNAVNAMQPTGGTNQAIGLAWAWQTLLPNSPVPAPAEDANTTYNRVIILLSDGLNTEDRWPDYGNGSTQNTTSGNSQFPGLIDARQQIMCDNLKNAKDSKGNPIYTIYTIQVNTDTPADPTSAILKYCASSPDKFYMLTSSGQIATTFNAIGSALSQLRVAN